MLKPILAVLALLCLAAVARADTPAAGDAGTAAAPPDAPASAPDAPDASAPQVPQVPVDQWLTNQGEGFDALMAALDNADAVYAQIADGDAAALKAHAKDLATRMTAARNSYRHAKSYGELFDCPARNVDFSNPDGGVAIAEAYPVPKHKTKLKFYNRGAGGWVEIRSSRGKRLFNLDCNSKQPADSITEGSVYVSGKEAANNHCGNFYTCAYYPFNLVLEGNTSVDDVIAAIKR